MSGLTLVTCGYLRPYYLERQLDGWLRARGLENVSRMLVAVGTSPRLEQINTVIKQFSEKAPFEVSTIMDDPPAGPHTAIGNALMEAFRTSGMTFFTDEDILPADDVIEYMMWGLERFRHDTKVLSINAHSECGQGWDGPFVRDDPYADPAVVRLKPYHNQWGWATWADRWNSLLRPEWDWDGRHRGCDWNIMRLLRDRRLLAATPDASRTNHIGYREGVFANQSTLAFSEAASFREHRDPAKFRVEPYEEAE